MERIRAAAAPAERSGEAGAAAVEREPGGGPEERQRTRRKNFAKPDAEGANARKMLEQYFARYTWCSDEKVGSTASDLAEITRQLRALRSCACKLKEQDPKAAEAA